ncbi:hypothetical protein HMPREF9123_1865 [Neisseria bacilliformis ATCC BAA-1200]|jgi:hypothetical protein|uniref:Uncharacterized protein n=1 Tax=Neisseria bacilliformis ATCC BAA-1200 TaxID=888742 RepID=F2BDQ1_9NEIS|nr:hypothetical protein HMPREF9123_1865 [Neisseria bacilliformis ATCC BAA-1200]
MEYWTFFIVKFIYFMFVFLIGFLLLFGMYFGKDVVLSKTGVLNILFGSFLGASLGSIFETLSRYIQEDVK